MNRSLSSALKLYRDAYSGHPRQVWALTVLTLINRAGTMVLPFMSVYLTTILGFSLKDTGIIMSAFGVGSLVGSYTGGRLSDHIGARMVIILSLAISGILFINMQFVETFSGLYAIIFCTAMFGEAYRPAMMIEIAKYVPNNQMGRTMSLIRLSINLGMSAAPVVGGFIAATIGYSWLFWVDGMTCISAAAFFFIVSRQWRDMTTTEHSGMEEKEPERDLKPLQNMQFVMFLITTLLVAFSFIQWFHTVPVFIKTELGLDERYIGTLLGLSSFYIILVEMPAIHAIEQSGRITPALKTGLVLIGISFLFLLPASGLWVCLISIFIWTTGEILFLPFNTSMSVTLSPSGRRGDYMAWYWTMWSVANILAPVVGMFIAEHFGFETLWIFIALLVPVSLFLVSRVRPV